MGQRNMFERAQELGGRGEMTTALGSGTTVRCLVPFRDDTFPTRSARAAVWITSSAAVGFLLYSCAGENDQGRPPYLFGVEFLVVFAVALGIAGALAALWYLWRPRKDSA